MHTSNTIEIRGEPERVLRRTYELAADLQCWPKLLPHYRYMKILEESATHKIAAFGATRYFLPFRFPRPGKACGDKVEILEGLEEVMRLPFPVKWTARQELFPEEARITFKHLRGISRGMWVEWRLMPTANGVHVEIYHELTYPIPLLGNLFATYIVGRMFVQPIAGKTLQCFKTKIEGELL